MHSAAPAKTTLFATYFALIALLALSAAAAKWQIGPLWNLFIALGIAAVKTALVFLVFMQLRYQRGLVRVFALAGFLWLAISGVLTFSDYLTRGWTP
ncbi:oxidase [Opitutaceae bacterium EW11]|nr:oxidase [Opitutaceae bacterium EW11]